MISIPTIILFFVYTWGLGYSVTYFIKKKYTGLEEHLMNIGIGLGVFSILSIIMNTLGIPLDWKYFLILSMILPAYTLCKNYDEFKDFKLNLSKIQLKKSNLIIFMVILIAILSLFMYAKGAFSYPYLEDSDPWGHSVGVKYIAMEKTAFDPELPGEGPDAVLSYVDPYPPAYDILQGILHQTAKDLNWSLKFFNALIISLGFIFFFFMARQFLKSDNKALFATIVFASVPAYLSHFIWAHSLVVTLFLPTIYCLGKSMKDVRWILPTIFMIGGIWVAQNLSQPVKLTTMILIYLVVISIANRKTFWAGFVSLLGGMLLSQFWWMAMVSKYGFKEFVGMWSNAFKTSATAEVSLMSTEVASKVGSLEIFGRLGGIYRSLTSPGGTGSRAYSFNDFFVAKSENMINNPIGLGIVVSILVAIGLVFLLFKYRQQIVKKENALILVSIFWLIFTFWGVNGQTFFLALLKENGKSLGFSVARAPFRLWMLFSIPVALIATEGAFYVMNRFRKGAKILVMLLLVVGIIFTSTTYKYDVNTAIWSTGAGFASPQEAFEYGAWFETIPVNSKVFLYAPRDKAVIGFGGFSCLWCENVRDFRKDIIHRNADELYLFLKENEYEYFIINPRMDQKYLSRIERFTQGLLDQRYKEIVESGHFDLAYQNEGVFAVLKVK
jgi:hypothetical protein